jgi:hypothetical protein
VCDADFGVAVLRTHGPEDVRQLDDVIAALTAGLERLSDERTALPEVKELIRMARAARRAHRSQRW